MALERATIRALLTQQIEGLWGRGELDLVSANYAPDVVDHMPVPGQAGGLGPMRDVVALFRTAIPDLTMHLHATLAAGDLGVDVWTLRGTFAGPLFGHAPTGLPVRMSGIDMVRVGSDGRIRELWHVEEMAALGPAIALQAGAGGRQPEDAAAFGPPRASAEVPPPETLGPGETMRLAVARRHIEEMWALGRAELAETLYTPDVIDHNPAPGQRAGIPGMLDALHLLRDAAPDLRLSACAYVADGDLVADRWVMRGTHTGGPLMGVQPQGRRFEIAGMDVVRIRDDGRITDIWHVEEFHRLLAQIR
jgi:predicted ester cyclase